MTKMLVILLLLSLYVAPSSSTEVAVEDESLAGISVKLFTMDPTLQTEDIEHVNGRTFTFLDEENLIVHYSGEDDSGVYERVNDTLIIQVELSEDEALTLNVNDFERDENNVNLYTATVGERVANTDDIIQQLANNLTTGENVGLYIHE